MSSIVSLPARSLLEEEFQEPRTAFGDVPAIMSPKKLGVVLEIHPVTLAKWREKKKGPKFRTPPGTNIIRYYRHDVLAWLDGDETCE